MHTKNLFFSCLFVLVFSCNAALYDHSFLSNHVSAWLKSSNPKENDASVTIEMVYADYARHKNSNNIDAITFKPKNHKKQVTKRLQELTLEEIRMIENSYEDLYNHVGASLENDSARKASEYFTVLKRALAASATLTTVGSAYLLLRAASLLKNCNCCKGCRNLIGSSALAFLTIPTITGLAVSSWLHASISSSEILLPQYMQEVLLALDQTEEKLNNKTLKNTL